MINADAQPELRRAVHAATLGTSVERGPDRNRLTLDIATQDVL